VICGRLRQLLKCCGVDLKKWERISMTQIIALYEPAEGTPWYFWLFTIFIFLLALSLPFLIRFVVLRRPVLNLWSAILLSFICGFIIAVFVNILFPIYQHGQIYLFAAALVYSYCAMHIGYRNYCIEKLTSDESDNEQKDEQKQ